MVRIDPTRLNLTGYGAKDPACAGEPPSPGERKTLNYILPLVIDCGAATVLDVGCGSGAMVMSLRARGFDAYGVDRPGFGRSWNAQKRSTERFFIVDPAGFELPFEDDSFDFVFSLGGIAHAGPSIRRQWLREVYRVARPGGYLLVGGPNRNFPIDVAQCHGPQTSRRELWGYRDFAGYLAGHRFELTPVEVQSYVACMRVPALVRPLVETYVNCLPRALRGTGFNPWVMALIRKAH